MEKEITTKGFQDKVKLIAHDFVEFVNSNREFHENNLELMLLLNKISSNIQAATLLSSRILFSESKIILRSAFETLVLFEYLLEFPKKLENYKEDNIITEIQNIYGFYKRGYLTYEKLIEIYDKLSINLKTQIPFKELTPNGVISYNTNLLDTYFKGYRDGFKPISQKTLYMLDELKKAKNFISDYLQKFQIIIYNINSQVAHSRLDTLFLSVQTLSDKETIYEMQWCFRHSTYLLYAIIWTLETKCNYKPSMSLSKNIVDTMQYLNFDIPKIKQENRNTSLIELIKYCSNSRNAIIC